jgi:hypothetical protein
VGRLWEGEADLQNAPSCWRGLLPPYHIYFFKLKVVAMTVCLGVGAVVIVSGMLKA